jgi:hypothetical protein
MHFSNATHDKATLDLMTAALELAWVAVSLELPGLLPSDRAAMAQAISTAAAGGERNFRRLQQRAIDALAPRVKSVEPVERRQHIRLVSSSDVPDKQEARRRR